MNKQPWWLLLIALYLPMSHAEDAELAKIFQAAGAKDTMVIANLDGTHQFMHNDSRANKLPLRQQITMQILKHKVLNRIEN